MTEPTSTQVKAFWKYMSEEYGSKVIPKVDASEMIAVATFLDVTKIQSAETFMKHFTTTLGNRIYIPFEVGVASDTHDLWAQIVVCVHEHQHIEQGQRDGWVTFGSRYLTSGSYRAGYEAEAYGCNLEMQAWRYGPSYHLEDYAERCAQGLSSYGCKPDQIEQAEQQLKLRIPVIVAGGVETRASQRAMAWLNEHAPELALV